MPQMSIVYSKTGEMVSYTETRAGWIQTSECIDNYYTGIKIREHIIVKLDLISLLGDVFFEKCNTEKYRSLIYNTVAGNITVEEKISEVLLALVGADKVFKRYLTQLFYFDIELEDYNLYDVLCLRVRKFIEYNLASINTTLKSRSERIICESNGFAYITLSDRTREFPMPGSKYVGEVVSYAKVWRDSRFKNK